MIDGTVLGGAASCSAVWLGWLEARTGTPPHQVEHDDHDETQGEPDRRDAADNSDDPHPRQSC